MNTRFLVKMVYTIGFLLLLLSCNSSKKQFTVEGTINGADSLTLYIERRGHAEVAILDSVKLNKEGKYTFKQDALGYSEFYRLRLNNQSINFSIDSTETIKINSAKDFFATKYEVEGSYSSTKMKEASFDQLAFSKNIDRLRLEHAEKALTDAQFSDSVVLVVNSYKEKAKKTILEDYMSPVAYFTLFQKIDDLLIFSPDDKDDLILFRAIATVWDNQRPESPRTAHLKSFTLAAIANKKALERQDETLSKFLETPATDNRDYFSVSLPDVKGKVISTRDLKGKYILLDFTAYQTEYSPAHSVRLNKAYEKYKSQIEIYQVSFDNDKHTWQNAASNLPWICVRDNQSLESPLIAKFNISTLPMTYILDKDGEILKRLEISADLNSELAKIL